MLRSSFLAQWDKPWEETRWLELMLGLIYFLGSHNGDPNIIPHIGHLKGELNGSISENPLTEVFSAMFQRKTPKKAAGCVGAFPLCFVASPVAGLLNATFGNAVEMIISVFALREGLTEARQILGGMLGG